MSALALAQAGGVVAAAGTALLLVAPSRWPRLGGLLLWAVGMGLFLPLLVPAGHEAVLAAAAAAVAGLAVGLALLFRAQPWALAFLALLAAPVRFPVAVGDTEANLLVPLYAVIAGTAVALAWSLLRDPPARRELGLLAWPLALLVLWTGSSLVWSADPREGAITLFFFVFPFSLLAVALARLPWSPRALAALLGLLVSLAVVFAAVGMWQWVTRDVFWNPKVIVANAYAPFYRVNSIFWDPSIYGRFLVLAILAALVFLLFRTSWGPVWEVAVGLAVAALWLGLLLSFSQSSFVALAVGVVLVAAVAWRWRALAAVAAVAAVMVPVGFTSPQLANVREHLVGSPAASLNRATSGRFQLVANGLRIARDHPVAGVGVGGFRAVYAERLGLRRGAPRGASHTTPVTVVAETGLVGLGLFAALLAAAFVAVRRGARGDDGVAGRTALTAGLCLAAILVHSLFYDAFFEDAMTWGLLALAALAAAAAARPALATGGADARHLETVPGREEAVRG